MPHRHCACSSPTPNKYYYLSYRRAIGFDANICCTYLDRLSVHRWAGGSAKTYFLAALADGESYVDSVNGITFTQVSHSTASSVARVRFSGTTCAAATPTMTPSPSSQNGAAGATLSYAVSLTNNDTAPCPNSTFTLAASVPSGWTGTVSPPSLTLAPGASAQATFAITSTTTALAGSYGAAVNAGDGTAAHAASATATYTVLSTCSAAAPRVTMTSSTTSAVAPGTAVNYTVAVTNNDPGTCNSSTFSLGGSFPSGWTAAFTAPSLSLAPGATGSTTLRVTSPTTAAGGTYSLQARASDPSVALHDATASASYSVASTTATAPGAPRSMAAAVSGNTATLSWVAPSTGSLPSNYLLYVGTRSGGTDVANGYNVGNALRAAGDLQKGTYYARVRAANAIGTSSDSNEVRFTVGRRLKTPGGFTVTWSGTTATLSWTAAAADSAADTPTNYVLEAGTTQGASDVARVNVGKSTVFRAEISSGTYFVRVKAQNADGESDPSEEIEVRTPGTPLAPTALMASGAGATVDLRWTASVGGFAATSYIIEAGSAPGLSNLARIPVGNVTRFTTTAPPGVYYVRVRGVNARGTSLASNEVVVRR